ncbi:hypothetical protein ACFLXE_08885, partial [Chloroflexota bacterium]
GSEAYIRYLVCLDSAARSGKGLRLAIALGTGPESDEESLLTLPWEYLYDGERGFFLGCSARTLITRKIVLPQAVPPRPTTAEGAGSHL